MCAWSRDLLIIDKDAILDEIPFLAGHAFVIVADRAEAAHLRLVGDDVDQFGLPYLKSPLFHLSSVAKLVPAKFAS